MSPIRNAILSVSAAAVCAQSALAQSRASEAEFARQLDQPLAVSAVEAAPPPGEGQAVQALYAAPVLQGYKNESMSVVAINEAGNHAILERYVPGVLFFSGSTRISLLVRVPWGWSETSLLSRTNGTRIAGVTLAALAFSGDGRYLVFRRHEDVKDYDSSVIKVLDLEKNKQILLGRGRGERTMGEWGMGRDSAFAKEMSETVRVITQSDWFKEASQGRSFAEMFPNPYGRCSGPEGVHISVRGHKDLVVSRAGLQPFIYPLKELPDTRAWGFQGAWEGLMSKDCTVGLTTVQELLSSTAPSLWYGTAEAYDAHMRVMEFGVR